MTDRLLKLLTGSVRDGLRDILSSDIRGAKDLILDPQLITPLNLIAGFSFLKSHNVDKIYPLETTRPRAARERHMVYIARATVLNMKLVAEQIMADEVAGCGKAKYHVVIVPMRDLLCEMVLEEHGVFGQVVFHPLELDFLAIDVDLLSMQLPAFHHQVAMCGDTTAVPWVAKGLLRIASLLGPCNDLVAVGDTAHMVSKAFLHLRGKTKQADDPLEGEGFASCILFDRAVDNVSALSSQLVYSGLVDEIFGYNGGFVDFGEAVTGKKEDARVKMCADDEVFALIRDLNFSEVGAVLNQQAKELGVSYDERHSANKISEIRQFVDKLGGLQSQHRSLRIHTNAAEQIMKAKNNDDFTRQLEAEHAMLAGSDTAATVEWIEECIYRQISATRALRLLCMLSCCHGGIKRKQYEHLRRIFLHSYGHEHLVTFANLKEMGLFTVEQRPNPFSKVRKRLSLLAPPDTSHRDTTYVHFGSAPASAHCVRELVSSEALGPAIEDLNKGLGPRCARHHALATDPARAKARRHLIVFLGGVTCSELAALRVVATQQRCSLLVATTNVVNGNRLVTDAVVTK